VKEEVNMGQKPQEENAPVIQAGVRTEDQELELLRKLVKKGVLELKPSFDKNGIHYVDAEEILKSAGSGVVKSVLEDLTRKGVLKPKIVSRVLTCPRCDSPEIHSKFTCPRCSFDGVELTELIEHPKCGYIGVRVDFVKDSGLVCPRCGTGLSEELANYRIIGNFYQCDNCGNRFDKPEVLHVCQNCGRLSTFQDVKYVKVFSYRVSEETVKQLGKELPILENVRKLLVDKGFRVRLRSKVVGSSGVQSSFDVFAEMNDVRLVFDVSVEGGKNDIVGLLAKKVDVNPTRAVIFDLSGGDELTLLGKIYDIAVFKVGSDQSVPDGFGGFLESLISKGG
jgi:predicted RNA-binding Zn-ribbon protein involved in translation (DUF1610 family)